MNSIFSRDFGHPEENDRRQYLMYDVKKLKEKWCKSTRLSVRRLVAAMTEPMSKCQPLLLNKCSETIECPIERIQH